MRLARTASSPLAVVSAREYLFDHQRDRQACVLFIEAPLTISVTFDRYKSYHGVVARVVIGRLWRHHHWGCHYGVVARRHGVVAHVVVVMVRWRCRTHMPAPDPAGCQRHVQTRVTVGVFFGVAMR